MCVCVTPYSIVVLSFLSSTAICHKVREERRDYKIKRDTNTESATYTFKRYALRENNTYSAPP